MHIKREDANIVGKSFFDQLCKTSRKSGVSLVENHVLKELSFRVNVKKSVV